MKIVISQRTRAWTAAVLVWGAILLFDTHVASAQIVQIKPPLAGVTTLDQLVEKLINIAFQITLPIAALAIMYSGFQFITAQGDKGKVTAAKDNFYNTCIGVAILLGSVAIISIIRETLTGLIKK